MVDKEVLPRRPVGSFCSLFELKLREDETLKCIRCFRWERQGRCSLVEPTACATEVRVFSHFYAQASCEIFCVGTFEVYSKMVGQGGVCV